MDDTERLQVARDMVGAAWAWARTSRTDGPVRSAPLTAPKE
jgi:hypothetical protein